MARTYEQLWWHSWVSHHLVTTRGERCCGLWESPCHRKGKGWTGAGQLCQLVGPCGPLLLLVSLCDLMQTRQLADLLSFLTMKAQRERTLPGQSDPYHVLRSPLAVGTDHSPRRASGRLGHFIAVDPLLQSRPERC